MISRITMRRATTMTMTAALQRTEVSLSFSNRDNIECPYLSHKTTIETTISHSHFAESTEQMLAAYINEVQIYSGATTSETVDKETNTECAFLPEKQRNRLSEKSSTSSLISTATSKDGAIDERVVKRSQTFSPSAVVSKSRYICRLNRSDSDSAMHFATGSGCGVGGHSHGSLSMQHSFHRGAVERRSLRFHTKTPKTVASSECSRSVANCE